MVVYESLMARSVGRTSIEYFREANGYICRLVAACTLLVALKQK